ncbi:MAG: hypothetical protein CMB82_05765 [Flammeovirgaceae bacterium]|nr:hypothetical protein [Flammeovirgaceae bacterium]|tara:strand:- start:1258 stop:2601 length:1344 start_codon:yes stop_codon:yes gene_type:complete
MSTRTIILLIFSAGIFVFSSSAQVKNEITRASNQSMYLNRKLIKKSHLILKTFDHLAFETYTPKKINFRVISPSGAIIHEALIKKAKMRWEFDAIDSGNYLIEIENLSFLFKAKVDQIITLNRFPFQIGAPKDSIPFSQAIARTQSIIAEGVFQINRFNDKNLNIGSLEKGDTLLFTMNKVTKRTPPMEIVNGSKELLFASRKSKNTVEAIIPVLSQDSFQITMISKAWLGQENKFRIDRITPFKHVVDTNLIPKPILYDTIPIDFLDTTIYLGAVRDYTNSNSEKFTFNFQADTSIAFWSVVFGTGAQYESIMESLEESMAIDSLADGMLYTDVLKNYVLGDPMGLAFKKDQTLVSEQTTRGQNITLASKSVEKTKGMRNLNYDNVSIVPSSKIASKVQFKSGINFALMDDLCCDHFLFFKNEDKNLGKKVYVKVLLFRIKKKQDI